MTGWERWTTRNCDRDQNLTRLTNGKCTNKNVPEKITPIKFSEIFRQKKKESYNPDQKIRNFINKQKNDFSTYEFCHFTKLPSENIWKRKDEFLDFANAKETLWSRTITVIPIQLSALGAFPKYVEKSPEELEISGIFQIIAHG